MPPYAKKFEPVLKYRYYVTITKLAETVNLITTAALPKFNYEEVEIHQKTGSFKVKGKVKYEDLQLTVNTDETVFKTMYGWIKEHKDPAELPENPYGTYVNQVEITIVDPAGNDVYKIYLHDAFIASVDFGDMDWSSSEVNTITLTLRYDYFTIV